MKKRYVSSAASGMSERFGLSLSVVDIGWPDASSMTWASNIAIVAIPVAILVLILWKTVSWKKPKRLQAARDSTMYLKRQAIPLP